MSRRAKAGHGGAVLRRGRALNTFGSRRAEAYTGTLRQEIPSADDIAPQRCVHLDHPVALESARASTDLIPVVFEHAFVPEQDPWRRGDPAPGAALPAAGLYDAGFLHSECSGGPIDPEREAVAVTADA